MSSIANVIRLPEDLQAYAEERVRSGEYASLDEVTHNAFRLLQERDERKQHVRADLAALFAEMEGGTYLEPSDEDWGDEMKRRLDEIEAGTAELETARQFEPGSKPPVERDTVAVPPRGARGGGDRGALD